MSHIELIHGNCLEIKEYVDRKYQIDAILADPPYGGDYNTDYNRFSGGKKESNTFNRIAGDKEPFDPAPWIDYPKSILWGSNLFADKLPTGTTLVWLKKRDNQLGEFLSDCELAWMKGGKGVYLFKHIWHGFDRDSERGETLHATQKPVALMRWCLQRLNLKRGAVVFDPYMGSGPVGKACAELGIDYIGCELELDYYLIAKEGIEAANNQLRFDFEGVAG